MREGSTAMRLVQKGNDVETRYGGRFVQSIDGLEGRGAGGSVDWFFFVNGLEADVGAAEYELSPGDVVQWDHRNWRGTPEVQAIVGRLPRAVPERDARASAAPYGWSARMPDGACDTVKRVLRDAGRARHGLHAGRQRHAERDPGGGGSLGEGARPAERLKPLEGPSRRSGVFARFDEDGRLELLDQRGRTCARRGTSAGLIAALVPRADELVWVVTGGSERRRGRGRERSGRLHPARRVRGGRDQVRGREAAAGGRPVSLVPVYRPRPSPLHAARAGATAALCGAFALVCAIYEHPLVLGGRAAAACWRPARPRAWAPRWRRAARLSVPLAILIALVNPLVYQGGDTLLVRGGDLPRPALRRDAGGACRRRPARACG